MAQPLLGKHLAEQVGTLRHLHLLICIATQALLYTDATLTHIFACKRDLS